MEENKKISVEDFVEQYKNASLKAHVIEDIIITKYIPFVIKLNVAKKIVQKYNRQGDDIQSQTAMMYLSFTASVLRLYTKLDMSNDNTDIDYDQLQQYRIIDMIFAAIGEDLQEYKKVFDMCEQDFHTNYLSTQGFIQLQVNKILSVFKEVSKKVPDWLAGINNETITKTLDKLDTIPVNNQKKEME